METQEYEQAFIGKSLETAIYEGESETGASVLFFVEHPNSNTPTVVPLDQKSVEELIASLKSHRRHLWGWDPFRWLKRRRQMLEAARKGS